MLWRSRWWRRRELSAVQLFAPVDHVAVDQSQHHFQVRQCRWLRLTELTVEHYNIGESGAVPAAPALGS